jgi:hypothetical protein
MSADEPLEDDPLDPPYPTWKGMPRSNRVAMMAGLSVYVAGGIATGLIGWIRDRNAAWLAYWVCAPLATAGLAVLLARGGRFGRWVNSPVRGEYKGPYWLGAEMEHKIHDRRMRILEERRHHAEEPPQ